MPKKGKLDFAVEPNKARLLHNPETRKNIEDLFRVQVKLSLAHQERQWVSVIGPNGRCKLAKAYTIALCDPFSKTDIQCDREFFDRLFNGADELLRTIEGDYAVVIRPCKNFTARIQGSDDLSVTLAMSKLGEIGCQQSSDAGIDRQLSAAMEQQCDPTSLSDLAHQPEVVKRTMLLEIVKDDSGSDDEATQDVPPFELPAQQEMLPLPPPFQQRDHLIEEEDKQKEIYKMKETDAQEKIDYFVEIGYNRDAVVKVLERLGKKASVNRILDRLIQVSSTKSPDNSNTRLDAAARQPSQQPPSRTPPGPAAKPGKQSLRYIVIDGSNVAMSHGKQQQVFSCMGIQLAVDFFIRRGHKQITAFVPAWRKETGNPNNQITDRHILLDLEQKGHLVFTPSRRTDRKRIVPYDDRFIVRLAMETNGIIMSNDYFRDLLRENEAWRETIENRVLPYSFVDNFLMIPDDPLGAGGPTLDEFLRCDVASGHTSCPKPEKPKPAPEKKMCKFYPKCTFGNRCAFRHPDGNSGAIEETFSKRDNSGARGHNDKYKMSGANSYAHATVKPMDEPKRKDIAARMGYNDLPKMHHYPPRSNSDGYFNHGSQDMCPPEPSKSGLSATRRDEARVNLLRRSGPEFQGVNMHPYPQSVRHNSFPEYSSAIQHQLPHPHRGPMPPPPQHSDFAVMQPHPPRQQQHYLHPQAGVPHDPRFAQQPVNSYSNMYYNGYPVQQPSLHHPSAMGHRVAVPHLMQRYEHYERDCKTSKTGDDHYRLVEQATALLQGLTSAPIEPKVRAVLDKNPGLTDLDTIIDRVREMD